MIPCKERVNHICPRTINFYHLNLQFIYKSDNLGAFSFLDVLVIRPNNNEFETTVKRKDTNTDIY